MTVAEQLLANFRRIATTDGGELALLSEAEGTIRLSYRAGGEANCAQGACALPQIELEGMMRDWLARKAPDMTLEVERAPG